MEIIDDFNRGRGGQMLCFFTEYRRPDIIRKLKIKRASTSSEDSPVNTHYFLALVNLYRFLSREWQSLR